ncbi:MAG: cytochrome c3 family protein [Desulfosarcinaceae bacterium]|nr:cytochrome c3 family protein [Desulfosarcinaceae bacterium]
MSTVDEQAKVPDSPAGAETGAPPAEAADESSGSFIFLFFIIGFFAAAILGWVVFPKVLYSTQYQPIDFSHAEHVEMVDEGCESCHYLREDGSFSGVPTLAECIDCHEEINGDSEDERIFYEEYVAKDREVPWLVYSRQPDCVFFSHAAHIVGAEMECATCHGDIGESDSLKPYQENRITGYSRDIWGYNIAGFKRNTWDRMKMDDCSDCHQEAGGVAHSSSVQTQRGACFVCHK